MKKTSSCILSILSTAVITISSCSVTKQINKQAAAILLNDSVISTGHTGISIYEPATNKYWYNYDATKYFVPASNTKLFSLYAGMKYLGDSLPGLRYQLFDDSSVNIFPTGDPTFLHPDFIKQPVLDFLQKGKRSFYVATGWKENALGYGWSWDDYNEKYMVERNPLPVYGNTVTFKLNSLKFTSNYAADLDWVIAPKLFEAGINNFYSLPLELRVLPEMMDSSVSKRELSKFSIARKREGNFFSLEKAGADFSEQTIPFDTYGINTAIQILRNDHKVDIQAGILGDYALYPLIPPHVSVYTIKSQPTDSMLTPMIHNSDNFFAEQTLLMVSNEKLGYMQDAAIIDTLLSTDLKDIPQKPKWVDGSGLSRYNLFTPQDFVYILHKMKNEFGLERLKTILATGNEGTLKNYYITDSSFIFAKTGSLSNHIALSGFLITKKNKLLIFSVLSNHFTGKATAVRRAVEKFIMGIREDY